MGHYEGDDHLQPCQQLAPESMLAAPKRTEQVGSSEPPAVACLPHSQATQVLSHYPICNCLSYPSNWICLRQCLELYSLRFYLYP